METVHVEKLIQGVIIITIARLVFSNLVRQDSDWLRRTGLATPAIEKLGEPLICQEDVHVDKVEERTLYHKGDPGHIDRHERQNHQKRQVIEQAPEVLDEHRSTNVVINYISSKYLQNQI